MHHRMTIFRYKMGDPCTAATTTLLYAPVAPSPRPVTKMSPAAPFLTGSPQGKIHILSIHKRLFSPMLPYLPNSNEKFRGFHKVFCNRAILLILRVGRTFIGYRQFSRKNAISNL